MKRSINILFSIFFLFAFILPLVAEQVHSYVHRNDEQCTEKQASHIHKTEHHCFLCNYIQTAANKTIETNFIVKSFAESIIISPLYIGFSTNRHAFGYSLRGPPYISC